MSRLGNIGLFFHFITYHSLSYDIFRKVKMKQQFLHSVIGLALLIVGTMMSPLSYANDQKQLDKLIQTSHQRGLFNGNIMVVKNKQLVYQKSLGYSDASKTSKIDKNSMFALGSITKEFNSVAIMILKEKGLLKLSDNLSRFKFDLPSWSKEITIAHLLNYTSGLPRMNFRAIKNSQSDLELLRKIKSLEFNPGEGYLYSNNNVFLQIRIIEEISGMTYSDFLMKNIFKPLAMQNARVSPHSSEIAPMRAFNNSFVSDPLYADNFPLKGMVNLTVGDLKKWLLALHGGQVISKNSLKILFDAYSANSQASLGQGFYKNNQLQVHTHHGSDLNWENYFHYNLKDDLLVILMTNNKNFKLRSIVDSVIKISQGKSFELPRKSLYSEIRLTCYDDVDLCIKNYFALKKSNKDLYDFSNPSDLNRIGYRLIESNILAAIKIFELAVDEFPEEANAHDSLAEAYLSNKNYSLALKHYQLVLSFHPEHEETQKKINNIKGRN